ncbi:hypothetical protein [Ferruginibacter sp. HRS2-29]|uniref:hypothetical protein n=1 Tax=Ferruginibacter sp. HRS2-29 TaxID=2487334 RepID=UPI0020CCD025|nr:hypothetical protein [Ferruginibacter sp. HRS2-29]
MRVQITLAVIIVLSFLLALWGGKKRIGVWYSLLISLFLSPLVAAVLISISPSLKSYKAYLPNSEGNRVLGIICYVIAGFITVAIGYSYWRSYDNEILKENLNVWPSIAVALGFYILGDYLCRMPLPEGEPVSKPIIQEPIKEILEKPRRIDYQPGGKYNSETKSVEVKRWNFKYLKSALAVLLIVLLITNPGVKRFKDFSGDSSYSDFKRTQNWFLFSIYEDYDHTEYIGILFNSFKT